MATYTYYWPEWACTDARALGLEGRPLSVFFGGYNNESDFSRFKVKAGDTVVAITCIDGRVHLLASLLVTDKTFAEPWLQAHPEDARLRGSRGGGQVLAGEPGAALDFTRQVPPDLLREWRYDSGKEGRPLKFLEQGRLKRPLSMQGVFRLTEKTAAAVNALLLASPAAPVPRDARVEPLLELLSVSPRDADAAAVLADAWQALGDARGELLALDLALHRAAPAEQPALWERLEALARKRSSKEALSRPGGFPFRTVYTCRDHVVWRVPARPELPLSFAEAERRLAGWARVDAVESERPRRTLGLEEARALQPAEDGADLRVELSLLHPETGAALPYQTKRFLTERSELHLGRQAFFFLRCVVPVTEDGPLLRAILARARASMPEIRREDEGLTLRSWEGRVAKGSELPID